MIFLKGANDKMPGCGKPTTQTVPTRFSYKIVAAKCGQTGIHGDPVFCEDCAPKYADRNWRQEAEENGEQYDEEDY